MTYFTDNPLERMMQQTPRGRETPRPRHLPKEHRCFGCSFYDTGCFGVCHRDLLIKRRGGANGNDVDHR
jgi:hypothetical protein